MKDKEFLMWIHDRMEKVYGESPCVDFMRKLRGIIDAYNRDIETLPDVVHSSLDNIRHRAAVDDVVKSFVVNPSSDRIDASIDDLVDYMISEADRLHDALSKYVKGRS